MDSYLNGVAAEAAAAAAAAGYNSNMSRENDSSSHNQDDNNSWLVFNNSTSTGESNNMINNTTTTTANNNTTTSNAILQSAVNAATTALFEKCEENAKNLKAKGLATSTSIDGYTIEEEDLKKILREHNIDPSVFTSVMSAFPDTLQGSLIFLSCYFSYRL